MGQNIDPEVAHWRAKHNALKRCVKTGERLLDDPALVDARERLLEARIKAEIAKAPPLSDAAAQRIAAILTAGQPAEPVEPVVQDRKTVVANRIAELDGGGDRVA